MLASRDAALIIGDKALLMSGGPRALGGRDVAIEKIDLGEVWTRETGLPFVYAFWAGRSASFATRTSRRCSTRAIGRRTSPNRSRGVFRDAPEQAAGRALPAG